MWQQVPEYKSDVAKTWQQPSSTNSELHHEVSSFLQGRSSKSVAKLVHTRTHKFNNQSGYTSSYQNQSKPVLWKDDVSWPDGKGQMLPKLSILPRDSTEY